MKDSEPMVSFRISTADYERLRSYAEANDLNISEAIRRAIKWMILLYNDDKKGGRDVRRNNRRNTR